MEPCAEEQPELQHLSQLLQNHISELAEGITLIERRLHSLKNTSIPEQKAEASNAIKPSGIDYISDTKLRLSELSSLKERVFGIHSKLNSII